MRVGKPFDLRRAFHVLLVTVGTWALVCAGLTVLLQDLRIFPAIKNFSSLRPPPPKGVEQIKIQTADGEILQVWRLAALAGGDKPPSVSPRISEIRDSNPLRASFASRAPVALIFRGNDGPLNEFFLFQEWFRELGMTSYLFNYRGYGESSGWPSEDGLALDGEAVLDYLQRREGIDHKQIVLMGYSIGTGPASALAKKHRPKALILLAPFVDLPTVVSEIPLLRYLKDFLWHTFPVKKNVATLDETCLAVAHGEHDQIIPVRQGREVFAVYSGSHGEFLYSERADHLNIFHEVRSKLSNFLNQCRAEKDKTLEIDG